MEEMATGSVDLIVTDPPYEIQDMTLFFAEMRRVLKDDGSMYVFGDKRIVARYWFAQMCKNWQRTDILAWHYKNSPKPKGRWRVSMQSIIYAYEIASYFNEDAARVPYAESTLKLNGRKRPSSGRLTECSKYDTSKGALPRDVLEEPALTGHLSKQRFGHPDQKPLNLIKKLIAASSREGEVVFDPFSGTGTTLLAAQKLNRKWIGCELEQKWIDVANRRLHEIPSGVSVA